MNNCTFILLGATGDLAKKKIIPALYSLYKEGVTKDWVIIGASKDTTTSDQIVEAARPFIQEYDEAVGASFKKQFQYHDIYFADPSDFKKLKERIDQAERAGAPKNKIIYCAIPSDFFCSATQELCATKIITREKSSDSFFQRIVYEKPFGWDSASAAKLHACITQHLEESQVYCVDHYLSKELVGNIALIRFANSIFEPLWNAQHIESVHIALTESVGLEGRGDYYDSYGVVKDVVQNHMLQLLALVAMEAPTNLEDESMQDEKAKVLSSVQAKSGILGQYQGYQQEPHVDVHSTTPTFALLEFAINNKRWQGVPFYFSTGKYLNAKETFIRIKFRTIVCALEQASACKPNYLTIRIAPEGGFTLTLNARKPGTAHELVPVNMDFCHSCIFPNTPEDYHNMIEEIARGDQSIAVHFNIIQQSWRITDALLVQKLPQYTYAQGSKGPEQAIAEAEKKGIWW